MARAFRQLTGWFTTISIVTSGLLFSVHVQGPDGCAMCNNSQQELSCASEPGCDPQESGELPFLPPHDSSDCAICHFSGDFGDLLPDAVNEHAAEFAELFVNRKVSMHLLEAVLAYQGRAPPQHFSR